MILFSLADFLLWVTFLNHIFPQIISFHSSRLNLYHNISPHICKLVNILDRLPLYTSPDSHLNVFLQSKIIHLFTSKIKNFSTITLTSSNFIFISMCFFWSVDQILLGISVENWRRYCLLLQILPCMLGNKLHPNFAK